EGFETPLRFSRSIEQHRLTPMPIDYDTVGQFYARLSEQLKAFVAHHGEGAAFCGNPALQLTRDDVALPGIAKVICLKTALLAFDSIVQQGEGASAEKADSHFQRFLSIRQELAALKRESPGFLPAFPAACNPLLRRPLVSTGRVFIEDETAAQTVDLANACYALMLRLLAYAYTVQRGAPEKGVIIDLGLGLMRAMTLLGERAARLPAGPSHPGCNAGMSFTALRDAAPLLTGVSAHRFFRERLAQLTEGAACLARGEHGDDARVAGAQRQLAALTTLAERRLSLELLPQLPPQQAPSANARPAVGQVPAAAASPGTPPTPRRVGDTDEIEGDALTLLYEGKKCIPARFCVTGAPKVFLANVPGPWIHPSAMDAEGLVAIAHACPSGAIRYRRKDGRPDESAPPVNLIAVREAGPYAFRGALSIDGEPAGYRATLCRCGASKNKPYCDGSHHEVRFDASGEPATGAADMLPVRDGPLDVDPQLDGPLSVRGNLEITSGTGRVVARLTSARLCRCGGSATKPFCDGTHARIGFRSS
ncbi:MAG TPA: CDGSH iron-sulfur domain-containing protein, partial [Polyangiales bacterium]